MRTGIRFGVMVLAVALLAGCATPRATIAAPGIQVTQPAPATLTGTFYRPAGDGPFPTMILLHGCSGMRPNGVAWAEWLRSEGYAAFVLDSFGGRGLTTLCGNSAPLRGPIRAYDVFATVKYLKTVPGVDGDRIGAMGFSHGGWTVLWAGAYAARHPDAPLKALVAFYPSCGDVYRYPAQPPLLMLLGAKDDWTPAEPCRTLADSSRRQGAVIEDFLYPDARHGFDAANVRGVVHVAVARQGRGATVAYDPQAHADAEKQLRRFLAQHLK